MAAVLTFTMSLIKLVLKNLGSEDRSDDLSFLMCGRNVDYKEKFLVGGVLINNAIVQAFR